MKFLTLLGVFTVGQIISLIVDYYYFKYCRPTSIFKIVERIIGDTSLVCAMIDQFHHKLNSFIKHKLVQGFLMI